MVLGIVSNCWKTQLQQGTDLVSLIQEASRRGLRAVELRQTCLGRFESPNDHIPNAKSLRELASIPELLFDVAVAVPYLSLGMSYEHPVFAAGKSASQAVSGDNQPHLRLVDLTTTAEDARNTPPDQVAKYVAQLVTAMTEINGKLSIENARQPWAWFRDVLQCAWERMGRDADRLQLCFDPCNLVLAEKEIDVVAETAALSPETISMVHIKQCRDGTVLPAVCDGEVDWSAQLLALRHIKYSGPYLFEIGPHEQVWEFLQGSRVYLERLGLISVA